MFESCAENIDGNNDIIGNSGNRNKKISPNKGTKTGLNIDSGKFFAIFQIKKYPRTRGRTYCVFRLISEGLSLYSIYMDGDTFSDREKVFYRVCLSLKCIQFNVVVVL